MTELEQNKTVGLIEDTKPTAYVLMRLYCKDIHAYKEYLQGLKEPLDSVVDNKKEYGRLVLIINDDTRQEENDAYQEYLGARNTQLDNLFGSDGWLDTQSPGGEGSANATFRAREFILSLKGNPNDIVISLDHDDLLKPGAVKNISHKMKPGGIVVSPFEMKDDKNLDITDDGGRKHNRLSRRLSCRCYAKRFIEGQQNPPQEHYKKVYFPHGRNERAEFRHRICDNRKLFCSRRRVHCKNFWTGRNNVADLSSIGWTKSYSRAVLEKYHADLRAFFWSRGGAKEFFKHNQAYEDFLDFYVLLFDGLTISGVKERTHVYNKHDKSITSSPKVDDFRDVRTAMLIALIDLCYAHEKADLYKDRIEEEAENGKIITEEVEHSYTKLRQDYKGKLLRFVSSKVYHIEAIIKKYNTAFNSEGQRRFADFAAKTHEGFFMSKLCRLGLRENRMIKQDNELFEHAQYSTAEDTKKNFEDLFSVKTFNEVPQYKEKLKAASPRHVLRKAVAQEAPRQKKKKMDETDEKVAAIMADSRTPHQRQLKGRILLRNSLYGVIILFFVLITIDAYWIPLFPGFSLKTFIFNYQPITAAIIAFIGVLLTLLIDSIGKVRVLADDEQATAKLYYSEFHDFIRHLEANLKIMLQIRKDLKEGKTSPETVHFDNLKWPESSSLFSNEIAKLIVRDRVDDFARLKVNLRNINNSADWLSGLAKDRIPMQDALEWEITRYFGYLANMYYLDKNSFHFPSQNALDSFIHDSSTKHRLTSLFMDYPAEERETEVGYFIDRYYDDRRMKRSVLYRP